MPRAKPPTIDAELSVRSAAGAPFRKRWMDLLASLDAQASITAAARSVGLSYKAAWDAIAKMNNLSDGLLVERSVGGKGGGGARLTARGRQLVDTFRAVEAENTRFVQRVNRRVRDAADLRVLGRMTLMTSARNHLVGRVVRVLRGAVNDQIELQLAGGHRIVAVITHESRQNLGLKKGVEAIALIKASSVILAADAGLARQLSARNCLSGTVSRITPGAVNCEVVVALAGEQSVAAVVTKAAIQALQLAPGRPVSAIFKASSVILGVAA